MSDELKKDLEFLKDIEVRGEYALVNVTKLQKEKESKIILLDHYKKEEDDFDFWGRVIKVGEEVKNIEKGDLVWLMGTRMATFKFGENEYTLVNTSGVVINLKNH